LQMLSKTLSFWWLKNLLKNKKPTATVKK